MMLCQNFNGALAGREVKLTLGVGAGVGVGVWQRMESYH